MTGPALFVFLPLLVLAVAAGLYYASGPLKQSTVESFEGRQVVTLNRSNAPHVVAALTIVQRWRRAGLAVGPGLGALWSLKDGELNFNLLAGFLGWFAGMVIAQWRINRLDEPGQWRSASLSSRSILSYVTRANLALFGITAAAWAVLAVVSAVKAGFTGQWAGYLAYSVLVLGALALTGRAIINRPSGFVDDGVREADDALRGHGLTVLVGSAIALLFPPIWAFSMQAAYPDGVPYSMDPAWALFIMFACLAVGWHVASASRSVREKRLVRR
ncbi:MAG: hypothetical protein Q4G35_03820 [Propionibacteriaceae bacterium]|nr:hypothetical protein [Propionibacteriaceae bacterium]